MAGQCPSCGAQYPSDAGYCPNDGTRIVSTTPSIRTDLIGRVLDDRYQILEPLAAVRPTASGTMYRGFQPSVARDVAIKIIHPQFAANLDRFFAAARQAAQLLAPAVANVYDAGTAEGGLAYVVSELVRGRSLGDGIQAMQVRRVVAIGIQLADALAAIHRANLVHGDLDPASIIVSEAKVGEQVKVLDVGISRAVGAAPSPLYLAPEVADGKPPDARSDLYALGVILYELLAGTPPFNAASSEALAGKHRRERPPQLPPHVPLSVWTMVQRLLAKPPAERPTASELRASLVDIQAEVGLPHQSTAMHEVPQLPQLQPTTAPPIAYPPPIAPGEPRSHRLLVIILVALIASAGGIAAIMLI